MKFEKNHPPTWFDIYDQYSVSSKQGGDFFQIFVAFLENMKFNSFQQ